MKVSCVGVKPAHSGGFLYEIRLLHRDAELSVSLGEAADDGEIWAQWREWARVFGLPALIERNDGVMAWNQEPAYATPKTSQRRSKKRRPAFIRRRFTRVGCAEVVHHEREIIART